MNINIENAKELFEEYIKKFDIENLKVKLKAEHILRVAENSKIIAQNLQLDEENVKIAELIGLLHDIGRFEQIKRFNTFADRMSEDHAELGVKILLDNNFLDKFVQDKKIQEIIIKAIRNHNKLKIEDNLNEIELLHAKIIRDADKLDIFKIIVGAELKDAVWFDSSDMSAEILNEKIYNDFKEQKIISYENMKNCVDQIVAWIGFIYDFNFNISLIIVKENNYINILIDKLEYKDQLTRERMKEIREIANQYIGQKRNRYQLAQLTKREPNQKRTGSKWLNRKEILDAKKVINNRKTVSCNGIC